MSAHNASHGEVTLARTLERLFFGTISERVARQCLKTTIIVKRYRGPVRFWLQRLWTVLTVRPPVNDKGGRPNGADE